MFRRTALILGTTSLWLSQTAAGIFVDGHGHYAAKGEARQNPGFHSESAFQAIDQYFRLQAEIRTGDKASFFAEFRLFDDPRNAYLGDTAEPQECAPLTGSGAIKDPANTGSADSCEGRHQSSLEPGYKPLQPRIRKAYARYLSPFCLFEVGRRERQWGMGILYDAGNGVFDTSSSEFDGITCDFATNKSQALSYSIGFDKLAETGAPIALTGLDQKFGPMNQNDDLEQYFVTFTYDTTGHQSQGVSQNIGLYLGNIVSSSDQLKTDIKIADLYLDFYFSDFILKNEILYRSGQSADPSFTRLGGSQQITRTYAGEGAARRVVDVTVDGANKVDALGIAGRLDWILAKSGSYVGPRSYNRGDFARQSLFFEYAAAPGDQDGYLAVLDDAGTSLRADNNAEAIAFHGNYKPALIMFNGRSHMDALRTDGVYDPYRFMNARMFALGYEFRSLESGVFSAKLITAALDKGPSDKAKADYEAAYNDEQQRQAYRPGSYGDRLHAPVGYKGKDLGYELDLSYSATYDTGFELGGAFAIATPGKALDIFEDRSPKTQFLLQAWAAFTF